MLASARSNKALLLGAGGLALLVYAGRSRISRIATGVDAEEVASVPSAGPAHPGAKEYGVRCVSIPSAGGYDKLQVVAVLRAMRPPAHFLVHSARSDDRAAHSQQRPQHPDDGHSRQRLRHGAHCGQRSKLRRHLLPMGTVYVGQEVRR
jgi:hypothetical protein